MKSLAEPNDADPDRHMTLALVKSSCKMSEAGGKLITWVRAHNNHKVLTDGTDATAIQGFVV